MLKSEDFRVFTLHIEGINLNTLPLETIGELLGDFAQLLGKDVNPKFHRIGPGSIKLAAKVRVENEIDVKTRGFLLRTGEAPDDAVRAQNRISKRLGVYHAKKATLVDRTDTKIFEIPIERQSSALTQIAPIARSGSLQGQVIRIGGKQDIVTVDIQDVDGHVYSCRAKREAARLLAHEIFGPTVRVYGTGKWRRADDGIWYVEDFLINGQFDVLDDAPLDKVLMEMHRIKSQWHDNADSFEELGYIRNGDDGE